MISFVCVGPYHTSTNEFYSEIMKSVKVLPTLSILLPAVSVAQAARPLRGIRIVSPANPVTIYLNGERVLSVINSCFIANLKSGDCRIEAYDGYGDNKRDGSPVFSEIARHSGREVTEISVENRSRACSNVPAIGRAQFGRLAEHDPGRGVRRQQEHAAVDAEIFGKQKRTEKFYRRSIKSGAAHRPRSTSPTMFIRVRTRAARRTM